MNTWAHTDTYKWWNKYREKNSNNVKSLCYLWMWAGLNNGFQEPNQQERQLSHPEQRPSIYHLHQMTRVTTNKVLLTSCSPWSSVMRRVLHLWVFPPNHKKTSNSQNQRPAYKIPHQSSKVSKAAEAQLFQTRGDQWNKTALGNREGNQDWVREPERTRVENGWNMNQVHAAVQGPAPMLISQFR